MRGDLFKIFQQYKKYTLSNESYRFLFYFFLSLLKAQKSAIVKVNKLI